MRIRKTGAVTPTKANIVDSYNTSTTDGYSANYINGLNTYSTTEQRIGTYLDKPLYRKTFVVPKNDISTTADTDEYRCNISDDISYDKIFIDQSHSAYILSSGNMFQNETKPSNPNFSVSFRGANPQSKFIQLFIGSSIYSSLDTVHITIEYTKTTDV